MDGSLFGETMPLWKRIYGVIWGSPSRTMEYIVSRPDFLGAGALMLGLNLTLTALQLPRIKEFTALTLQSMPNVKLTAEQMDVALNAAMVSSLAGSVALPPLLWAVMAAMLRLFNAFTGERATFRQLFAVVVFANLPVVLDGIIKSALILASPASKLASINISPALFLPPPGTYPGKLYILLSHFDPFILWSLVLTALGGSLAMKVPLARTIIFVGGFWLLYVVGTTFLGGL